MIDDQFARDRTGYIQSEILFDHRQGQIDARGHPGRCPDRSIDDEDAILLHLQPGKPRLEIAREQPVSGCSTAVEYASLGKTKAPVQGPATRRDVRIERCTKPRPPALIASTPALAPTINVDK